MFNYYVDSVYVINTFIKDVNTNGNLLFAYPNPSYGKFKISGFTEREFEIIIADVRGRKVFSQTYSLPNLSDQNINIDLSHHPKGLYFIKALSKRHNGFTRVIID